MKQFITNIINKVKESLKKNKVLGIVKLALVSSAVLCAGLFMVVNFTVSKIKYFNFSMVIIAGLSILAFVIIKAIQAGRGE